jgi:NTP pyrophosphatase (non-canonical NTP hydrolase)
VRLFDEASIHLAAQAAEESEVTSTQNFNFADFQRRQTEHDDLAHRDILQLSIQRRVVHYTLHFAKYQGQLLKASKSSDSGVIARLLTDSMIIVLSAANTLNIALQPFANDANTKSRRALGRLSKRDAMLDEYIEHVGEMAKACEALDHLEQYPSRQVLESSVANLGAVVVSLAAQHGVDLTRAVPNRWATVEQKVLATTENAQAHDPLTAVA